jgi:hypothetical protein
MSDTDFDLSTVDAKDEAELAIKHPKTAEPTGWKWTFYGPGHPKTIELANTVSREVLQEQREHRQAQLNGKKIKVEGQTLDDIRDKQVANIVARTKGFTPVKLDGQTIEFSPENATRLLLDRRKAWLLNQVSEYLGEDASFIQPSATS